ncbi:MAG TPA: methyltransferase domain-containing protein [Pseudonocardiaceae bacterium]|nr:methyltransferase domain-containing protein [Pseudonocardiaceae bacterium]
MTATLDTQFARSWISRWDAQQERYIADREDRFAVIGDVVGKALHREAPTAGATVLDLGCGPGSLAARLADRMPGLRLIGIDSDPLLLALGRARYGYRVEFVDADLTAPELPVEVPDVVDAVVSTTALHWLDPQPLAELYRKLARRIRPGGVFVDGDHMPPGDPVVAELAGTVREGRVARVGVGNNEDWAQWWAAAQSEPELAEVLGERSARAIQHHGSNSLSPAQHTELLLAAGFSSVGTVWQYGDDTVLVAVR